MPINQLSRNILNVAIHTFILKELLESLLAAKIEAILCCNEGEATTARITNATPAVIIASHKFFSHLLSL